MDNFQILTNKLGDRLKQNKDISPYFTLKTNTMAQYYFEAETRAEIIKAIKVANELQMPLFMLGGGSNLAVTKSHIEGLVVRNMYQKKEIVQDEPGYVLISFSSGYPMARVVKETTESGYEGFEFHLGLPGTIGGAVYMNSKWTHPLTYTGDHLVHASIVDRQGNEKEVERDYFQFAYDYSILQETHEIVLEAVFKLKKSDPELLKKKSQEALAYRHATQPHGVATGGCFFRNISAEDKTRLGLETTSAGNLIDKAGLKNTQIGNFIVSDKHANFIINKGDGNPEDLKKLLALIKNRVHEEFGVELKEEVVLV